MAPLTLSFWQVVQAEGRYLVTGDKGFADIRRNPPGAHYGVLLVRPDRDGIGPLLELMQAVLGGYGLGTLAGCVAVATPRGLRVRRAPGQSST